MFCFQYFEVFCATERLFLVSDFSRRPAFVFVFVVTIGRSDVSQLETRRAGTLLAGGGVGGRQLLVLRSPIHLNSRDTQILFIDFLLLMSGHRATEPYRYTSVCFCCVLVVCIPLPIMIVQSASNIHLPCWCFCCFVFVFRMSLDLSLCTAMTSFHLPVKDLWFALFSAGFLFCTSRVSRADVGRTPDNRSRLLTIHSVSNTRTHYL